MNEHISQYLFQYLENPDPQYAVMLKGKWGCGKSYFIQNWIKTYNDRFPPKDKILEPIYVSLYGLNNTNQITTAIDKVLHPYLYGKGAKVVKNALKIAGKVAFHTNIDVNKDNNDNISVDATLDSLSLLSLKGEEKIFESKLLVFDDLERCLIDMKLLLGYINNFVEHGACHVIIVGDETHVIDEAKKQLDEFKEKTIGREFEIQPNEKSAVDSFIQPLTEWVKEQKEFILDCFKSTKCDNLRILRQCLYDFSILYDEIDSVLAKKGDSFMRCLLGSYILTYCEYKGPNREFLKEWDVSYLFGDDTKDKVNEFQKKYSLVEKEYQIDIFNIDNIRQIIFGIETGQSLKFYVEKTLKQINDEKTPIERLANFSDLSNKEFREVYNQLVEEISEDDVPNMYLMGRAIALLIYFDLKKISKVSKKTIRLVKQNIVNYFTFIKDKDALYDAKNLFYQGLNSYGNFRDSVLGNAIMEFATEKFNERDKILKNKMEEALLNLTDDNVENLILLSKESTPNNHSNYSKTSIFKNIDADIFSTRILKLNNSSLQALCRFFSVHYEFGVILGKLSENYKGDLITLQGVKDKLEVAILKKKSVEKYMLKSLLLYIDGAIKRAGGDGGPIDPYAN